MSSKLENAASLDSTKMLLARGALGLGCSVLTLIGAIIGLGSLY